MNTIKSAIGSLRSSTSAWAEADVRVSVVTAGLSRAAAQSGSVAARSPLLPPVNASAVKRPLPRIDDRDIGDGRSETALMWRLARHADFIDRFVTPNAELLKEVQAYQKELAPTNLPLETDYQGKRLIVGNTLELIGDGGAQEVLVPESLVPAGRSIAEFDLSLDGRFVAFSTASTGDDRIWNVIDRRTHDRVMPEVTFNSFGNTLRFATDSTGVYYPNHKPAGYKVRPEIMFQSLAHLDAHTQPSPPVMVFEGECRLAHFIYPLTPDKVLVEGNISIGPVPGFRMFNTLLTRAADGTYSSDQGTVLPTGDVGRVVSAEADAIIYQTPGVFGTNALTRVDPANGQPVEIVSSQPNVVLHSAQRVGDKICCWCLTDDQHWFLRIFNLNGDELKTIEPAELGMPDWCSPSLSFTGDAQSKSFSDFTVSSTLKSPRTYRLHLDTLTIEPRLSGKEVDLDPSKFTEEHGTFTARDGAHVPYHLYIPKDVPEGEAKRVVAESYGSIGIVLSRGWNIINQTNLASGFAICEVGARGGGEGGINTRNAGAKNRLLTIDDQSDAGYFLRDKGFAARVGYGRSWGGWKEENGAVRDPEAFTQRVSVVSAGNAQRLVVQSPEIWSAGDFGAGMAPNGAWDDQDEAFEQARKTSTPQLIENAAKLPPMLFVSQNQDDRAEPGSAQLCMNILERRFGERNPLYSMISVDGGHGANAHRALLPLWYRGVFGPGIVLRPQILR